MSRGLDTAQQSAALARHRVIAPLVEMDFLSGPLRLTTAPWDITAGGKTYMSTLLMSIRQVSEAVGSFEGVELTLTGLDAAAATIAAQEPYRGRLLTLSKVYLDPDTHQIIGTPVVQFIGRIRAMPSSETNNTATIAVQAEHYEAELRRAFPLRYNDADQQRLFPGDRGAEFVEVLAEKRLVWPSRESQMRR
jgi:hypothetical protein